MEQNLFPAAPIGSQDWGRGWGGESIKKKKDSIEAGKLAGSCWKDGEGWGPGRFILRYSSLNTLGVLILWGRAGT